MGMKMRAAWIPGIPLLLWACGGSANVSPCPDWNSEGFFSDAEVADVSRCLAAGADANARDEDGTTPLHWVARYGGHAAVAEALLAAGAEVDAEDGYGMTPLHLAARYVNAAVTEILLAAGADQTATDP